ncbi:MAG: valine--tRNA ligase [Bacteroidetes bacterium]|nr:valine--tRNA ligase [Bacteroidota bacterium]
MSTDTKYNPAAVEDKWYKYWLDNKLFRSVPDGREPYTIVIPPPNVTGVLHMGHMLNNTIQDLLIRRARMMGKNALWVPGTDHASIATEAKVVKLLEDQGIKKQEIGREEFLKHAFVWKDKYGGIILDQLKKLGASCDWERTSFTMDEGYYRDVVNVFIDLYNKGYIYRGVRMVNWDPQAKTTVSDEEVLPRATHSKMCYVKYMYEDGNGYITVATVRPETIMGDVAIAVHPADERYRHLHGKKVMVPFVNRAIPIICDEAIDIEFGTGCLKVTPAHDIVDYEIGQRHGLPVIDCINDDGTIAEIAGAFVGLDRFVARKQAIKTLEETGLLEKIEEYTNNVGYSERTDAAIEPKLSMQWFLKMEEFSKPALDAVLNGEVNLIPNKYVNTYKHWMENVRDWCLSRQLWWGHRIPAWYNEEGKFVVAATLEEAEALCKAQNITYTTLKQDEDVLDTWASSWLWPISVFDGIENPENEEIKYYYPTNDLVTAPEILFFWVARMIMAGHEYQGKKPFNNVYLTGIVRDKQRRKMSKSLGNSPDPLDLIAEYGADGVRLGMLLCSPAGNDILFDESQVAQGRGFSTKLWNAYRLINSWEVKETEDKQDFSVAINWFHNRFDEVLTEVNEDFNTFKLSEGLMKMYKLVWDDFCSWYLEMVKPAYGEPISKKLYTATIHIFDNILRLLHPIMPFITEELWQSIEQRKEGESICVAAWPSLFNSPQVNADKALQLITEIRSFRNSKNISPKDAVDIYIITPNEADYKNFESLIAKLANISSIQFVSEKMQGAYSFLINTDEAFIPVELDKEAETKRIQEEINYLEGFLKSVDAKLGNEKFMANAKPDVIEKEQQKKADALNKMDSLKEQLELIK